MDTPRAPMEFGSSTLIMPNELADRLIFEPFVAVEIIEDAELPKYPECPPPPKDADKDIPYFYNLSKKTHNFPQRLYNHWKEDVCVIWKKECQRITEEWKKEQLLRKEIHKVKLDEMENKHLYNQLLALEQTVHFFQLQKDTYNIIKQQSHTSVYDEHIKTCDAAIGYCDDIRMTLEGYRDWIGDKDGYPSVHHIYNKIVLLAEILK